MKEHAEVIRNGLKTLYQRVTNPTAQDQTRLRVALKAVDQLLADSEPRESSSVSELTVTRVQELVESGEIDAAEALDTEREGKNRSTLVSWLEQYLEEGDEA